MPRPRAWLGLAVGLSGAALLGWALFTAFTSAGCLASAAASGSEGCAADPPAWIAAAIPAGIVLAMIGIFMGGGGIVFSALFLAVGLSALVPTILGMMPDMALFGWLFGGIFFVCGLLPLFGGLALRRLGAGKQAMAMELMRSGTTAVGTIVEVRDTGMTINDDPRVMVRMRVEPLDGSPPVERSKTVTVSRLAIPRPGERYPVWFDPLDPEKWMWGTDLDERAAPAEVRDMFARARAARGDDGSGGPDGAADDGADSPVEELARLSGLWKDGALTDREFAEAKARLLPRIGR